MVENAQVEQQEGAPQTRESATATGATRGVLVTVGGQLLRLAIQVLAIAILSRILAPSAFGLVAMVTAIVGVAELLRDAGLSTAAVQAKTLSAAQSSNLFWINTSFGLTAGALVASLSSVIADLYGRPELAMVVLAVSTTFVVNGIGAQFRAQLNRALQFKRLALADIAAQAVGLILAVGAAYAGAGYWSLVIQQVGIGVATTLVLVGVSEWRPGRPARGTQMRSLVSFGGYYMGTQVLVYATSNIGAVALGKLAGATQLGFYNRANQLLTVPLTQLTVPVTSVALPVLSSLQDEKDRYTAALQRAHLVLSYAGLIALATVFVWSHNVVTIALGPGWVPAELVLRILAVGGAFQILSYSTFWTFTSLGFTKQNFHLALSTRPVTLAAVLSCSPLGINYCAAAYAGGQVLSWAVGCAWLYRCAPEEVRGLFSISIRVLLTVGLAASAALGVREYLPLIGPTREVLASFASIAIYLVLLGIPRQRADLRLLNATFSAVVKRKVTR